MTTYTNWTARPKRLRALTLRARLVLWMALLLFASVLAVTLFINLGTALTLPSTDNQVYAKSVIRTGSGAPIVSVAPVPTPASGRASNAGGSNAYGPFRAVDVLRAMRLPSLIGLGIVILLGTLGTYWLAGRALRPVESLSRTAREISAQTLDTRLSLDGPNDELKRLAGAFDAMLDRLQEGFERERRFVSDASHELRTPLAVVRGNLEVVLRDPTATLLDFRGRVGAAEHSLKRLERLAEDLLILAPGNQPLPTERILLGPMLDEIVTDLGPVAESGGVRLSHRSGGALAIRGDEALLRRTFSNLVENGIRYNRPGGCVTVDSYESDMCAIVKIEDSGIGIPEEDQLHVFERFWRGDQSRARSAGGSGLGLSLVDEVVRRHGGMIELVSVSGRGTVFMVQLPTAVATTSSQIGSCQDRPPAHA